MEKLFENRLILKTEPVPVGWYITDWAGSDMFKEIRRDLTETEIEAFKERKNKMYESEKIQLNISTIQLRLIALSQDFIQALAGEIVPDIENRKTEFMRLHNELRVLQGKEPREINDAGQ